jgi:hypothetical protein
MGIATPFPYSYTYDTLGDPDVRPEERPHVIGRQRFGSITIANSDAGAAAFTIRRSMKPIARSKSCSSRTDSRRRLRRGFGGPP